MNANYTYEQIMACKVPYNDVKLFLMRTWHDRYDGPECDPERLVEQIMEEITEDFLSLVDNDIYTDAPYKAQPVRDEL